MTPNAIRIQRHYQRSEAGQVVVTAVLDSDLVAGLVADGLLKIADLENREAIARALVDAASRHIISRGCP